MQKALRITELSAQGFRNLAPLSFVPGPRFNVLYGDNAAGKSSLLEAIDYTATLKSFRGARTDDLIQDGSAHSHVRVRVAGPVVPRVFEWHLHRDAARDLSIDGKRPRSIASWHASLQVVLFQPGDLELAAGGPEPRRAWMDRMLMHMDPAYAAALTTYTRALRNRNKLLRAEKPDRRAIGAFDELLVTSGVVIGMTRARLLEDVSPLTANAFVQICGEGATLRVDYRPRVIPEMDVIRAALASSVDKDLARGFTAEGPHADDVSLHVDASLARHHASQGQHRAIVLALKVAELSVLGRRTGHTPVLLLDDVSSELDRGRNRRFFALLSELGGQVFLSTTHREFILLDTDRTEFRVENGVIHSET